MSPTALVAPLAPKVTAFPPADVMIVTADAPTPSGTLRYVRQLSTTTFGRMNVLVTVSNTPDPTLAAPEVATLSTLAAPDVATLATLDAPEVATLAKLPATEVAWLAIERATCS
jgi:hypothetical protein